MKRNLLALFLLPLSGCQHLLYVHDASLGINITASTSEGTGKLNLGYDSETFALVPRFTPRDGNGQQVKAKSEAMSLVSVSNVDSTGLTEVTFNHVIMTGRAAKAAATDTSGLPLLRAAVYGPQATPAAANP
ncbi:MAG: hypothetical protein JWL69_3986 [Phycisphaerales bacterium]|nr:hypothetical protein [Phycisphaerales bacterium]MDB5356599.1 hypothetical protein [Phycisphaerales bacterium]